MSNIDNTTARMKDPADQLGFLAESMVTGSASVPIERMERDGQRQLVNSDRLPSRINAPGRPQAEARAEFEALGFTFGDPDPDDPMFMSATLPEGWKREGSDHAMWSYLLDTAGRQRVGIFYKAAFYDRSAHMHLIGLDWYVTCHVEYDGPLVLTDEWATRETVAASLARGRDAELADAEKYRGYATEDSRAEDNKARLREIVIEKERTAAKYAARLAELESAG